jgi:hypothetical protein
MMDGSTIPRQADVEAALETAEIALDALEAAQLALFEQQAAVPALPGDAEAACVPVRSRTYMISCTRAFRDDVQALARERGMSPSSLACAALALFGSALNCPIPDPGPATAEDIEHRVVTAPSGRTRWLKVPPKLKLTLPAGTDQAFVRRALAMVIELGRGSYYTWVPADAMARRDAELRDLREQLARLHAALDKVSFRPLRGGVKTAQQAAYVLGMPSEWGLDEAAVATRYRLLAPIYHPDSGQLADPERMAQVNTAKTLLLRQLRTP